MKKLLSLLLATLVVGHAHAAPAVEQSAIWTDGNVGGNVTSGTIAFDIVNADSILIATFYVDTTGGTAGFTSVRFGDGGGVGTGDVASDATFTDDRMYSYVFLNPPTDSGLSLRFDKTSTSGAGLILYEVTGASTSLADITTVTGANSIDTTTADELIVSFAGRNGVNGAPTVNTSLFTDEDQNSNGLQMRGGGSLSSASAVAPSIGTQDITWNNANEGRIAYAFEEGVVTPPSSISLIDFVYDPADGSSSVSIVGEPSSRYQLVEADDLDFSNPDQSPVPLDGATVGVLDGNAVITDGNGDATIQFNLGTTKSATFIRAEDAPLP